MIPGLCYSQIADTVCGVGIANIDTIITANIDTVYSVAWYRCGDSTITHGGVTYNIVQIGNQCWFSENLNIGTMINSYENCRDNEIFEKHCYDDNEENCTVYGGLYQWNEAMQWVTSEGAQGICPTGWHIPTDSEYTELTDNLGGETIAGGKMKEYGTAHWMSPNTGATNSSGFTGLPGGALIFPGNFAEITMTAYFFTSTQTSSTMAYGITLTYDSDDIKSSSSVKSNPLSIRCIKN